MRNKLKSHIKEYHENLGKIFCEICSARFGVRATMLAHMKVVHGTTESSKICKLCDKVFFRNDSLDLHVRKVHNGPPECIICSKTFAREDALTRHIRVVHEKDPALICNICSKNFSKPPNLKRHIQTVHQKSKALPQNDDQIKLEVKTEMTEV